MSSDQPTFPRARPKPVRQTAAGARGGLVGGAAHRKDAIDRSRAEAIAAEALAALADDPPVLVRFLRDTGMGPADLAASAGTAETLIAVLEFVLADEALLLTVAARRSLPPEAFTAAIGVLQRPALGSA
jgi:hypothetical protein